MWIAWVLALVSLARVPETRTPVSVAFDLGSLSAVQYHRIEGLALERNIALRLVQEGFAVVTPEAGADVLVRGTLDERGALALIARARDDDTAPLHSAVEAAPDSGAAGAWHLEVTHKVLEMARVLGARVVARRPSLTTATLPPAATEAAPSAPTAAARPTEAIRATAPGDAPARPSPWELGLGAGMLQRAGGTDPLVGLLATHARGRLRLHLDLLGARSRGDGIDVWEGELAAGVGAAVVDGPASVDVGLAGGVIAQRFSLSSPWASDRSGTRAAPGAWLPVRARWAAGRFVVGARAALGLGPATEHTSEGATLWSRGRLRLEAMLVVAWAL